MLVATLVVLLGTGVMLTAAYEPEFQNAWESVWEISHVYPNGGFIRSLHHWSGNLFIILAALHLLRILWAGAYAGSRYQNYLYGLALLATAFFELTTGYFLPVSEISYWALVVGMSFLDYLPLAGDVIKLLVIGGREIGDAAVIRLYVFHIALLPLFLIALLSMHMWRLRKDQGLLKPERLSADDLKKLPLRAATTRELTVLLTTLIGLVFLAMAFPVAMAPRAVPTVPPNPVKAAWFFIAMQETLSYSAFWGGIAPILAGISFFVCLPLMAGNKNDRPIPIRKKAFFGATLGIIVAYAVFTLVGLYCRGPNWTLVNPWKNIKNIIRTVSIEPVIWPGKPGRL
ncbi:MAG: cytochrome b N-terminal domain-containing protein [Syntrophales bacterium]|nr:cytochrome b N-terminal domain-containing protein [Syntrophales bacterium]